MSTSVLLILIFIAATLPMIVSVFAALLPSARTRSVDGYFLYERSLDIDSFLKTSVGYSLQAAAIVLFFLWGISYGLYAAIVPIAWGVGYFLLGRVLVNGGFDAFLHFKDSEPAETIHGHIWKRLKNPRGVWSRMAVALIATATVIGLGGTLVAEVDYGSKIFLSAAKLTSVPAWSMTALLVGFTAFYILWGGYRAVVVTDRVQVPMAYGMFGLFTLGIAYLVPAHWFGRMMAAVLAVVFILFLRGRLRILPEDDQHNRSVAWLTFFPLAIVSIILTLLPTRAHSTAPPDILGLMFPTTPDLFGFGFLGVLSLAIANGIWQFIDISSLQRLESLKIAENEKSTVALGIYTAGFEAAGGWFLILVAALGLRVLGLDDSSKLVDFLRDLPDSWSVLLPMLVFSATVFMLSTVSCFISAIAFVAYFDFLTLIGLNSSKAQIKAPSTSPLTNAETNLVLFSARITTLVAVFCLFLGYQLLKLSLDSNAPPGVDRISQALYAIYAFQLAIAPTVFYVLFSKHVKSGRLLNPAPVIFSTLVGLSLAWMTATADAPWIGVSDASWYVIPPLWVVSMSAITFALVQWFAVWMEDNHAVV